MNLEILRWPSPRPYIMIGDLPDTRRPCRESGLVPCAPSVQPAPTDQLLGTGDGSRISFALCKTYGAANPYRRAVAKPVAGSVRIAVAGAEVASGITVDPTSGLVTFATPPPAGAAVTAGFRFDVPVRFDTDNLEIDLAAFEAGEVPSCPLIEILP